MYSHILVTVAYEAARDAAPSLDIAKALLAPGGQITLIHVMEPAPVFTLSYLPEGWREDMRSAIEADLSERAAALDNVGVVVAEGQAGRTLLEWAGAEGVDCIVIASHQPGLRDYLMGSTAAWVVRHAACAIHVLR